MNFSASGLSGTFGPRGASVGIGKRGTYFNSGIPGTGLYARERLDDGSGRAMPATREKTTRSITIHVEEDGKLVFNDSQGNPLPQALVDQAKKQEGDAIRGLIAESCGKVNGPIEDLARIHIDTPDPHPRQFYRQSTFDEPPPVEPKPKVVGFFASFLRSRANRIAVENEQADAQFRRQQAEWQTHKEAFEGRETERKDFLERRILVETDAMEQHLEHTLQDIGWPRETQVSFEILNAGKTVTVDVDLPELEDMPKRKATVPLREYRLSVKDMSATQIQKLYMAHVHGIGFRIIGETFAALPTVESVVLSAYSQRPDRATGAIRDEYLYSVRVARDKWQIIDFHSLDAVDVVEALARFELRREMTKTGIFKPVEPLLVS